VGLYGILFKIFCCPFVAQMLSSLGRKYKNPAKKRDFAL